MGRLAVRVLQVIIAVALTGSVFVQVVMVPLAWIDMEADRPDLRVPFVVIVVLGIGTLQVCGVCIWKLLAMVGQGTVFTPAAFRYVDVVIAAISVAAALSFAMAALGAFGNRTTPGDLVAPGVIALICGASLVIAGVAMLVLVLRMLLAQAVALDNETKHLQSELDEVI